MFLETSVKGVKCENDKRTAASLRNNIIDFSDQPFSFYSLTEEEKESAY